MSDFACAFTGHRSISGDELYTAAELLRVEILRLYTKGVRDFYAGGAMGFDLAASVVTLNLRNVLTDIRLIIAIPCANHMKNWPDRFVAQNQSVMSRADEVVCVCDGHYFNGVMQIRNRYMCDRSKYLIAWYKSGGGGTASTISYAKSIGMEILNLYDIK